MKLKILCHFVGNLAHDMSLQIINNSNQIYSSNITIIDPNITLTITCHSINVGLDAHLFYKCATFH